MHQRENIDRVVYYLLVHYFIHVFKLFITTIKKHLKIYNNRSIQPEDMLFYKQT